MIASYNFTNETWQLLDGGANVIDTFFLPDTYLLTPAAGASAGVLMSEDNTKHTRFISNAEIVAMGLVNIAGLTAQFNTDKASSSDFVRNPGTYENIAIGTFSGDALTTGNKNILIGESSGVKMTSDVKNTIIGNRAMYNSTGGSHRNVVVGYRSGYSNVSGDENTLVGYNCGYNLTGSGNVFLGRNSGYYEAGSNKLYISNSSTSNPLIHGDFSTGILTINSTFVIATQTAAAASALTPVEGMIVVVSSTDATFTSTGSWIYEGAAWTKITVV